MVLSESDTDGKLTTPEDGEQIGETGRGRGSFHCFCEVEQVWQLPYLTDPAEVAQFGCFHFRSLIVARRDDL